MQIYMCVHPRTVDSKRHVLPHNKTRYFNDHVKYFINVYLKLDANQFLQA